jgi:F-type H+-transporting ATPase subunit epsilon
MRAHAPFELTIARVDGILFSGEAVGVIVPGVEGEMTILSDHAPLISPLRAGTLTVIKTDGSREFFPIETGTLEVSDNQTTVLL